jgi:hypothetical protein
MSMRTALTALMLLALTLAAPARGVAAPTIGGCPVFPAANVWNTPVDTLPVHARSDDYIDALGRTTPLVPGFGTATGFPVNAAVGPLPAVGVTFLEFLGQSDPGPYVIPLTAGIATGPAQQVVFVDVTSCTLYELYHAYPLGGLWYAGSGAIYDLTANGPLRTDGFVSADLGGLPILPGLVRPEQASFLIDHALRFTASVGRTQAAHVWPARHHSGTDPSLTLPPMGQRFRMKATVDITAFTPRIQRIFQAMKTYGLILADNGTDWAVSGEMNGVWNDADLAAAFAALTGNAFEAVDVSALIVDPDSGQSNPPPPPPGPPFPGGLYVATGRVLATTGPAQVLTGPGPGRLAEIRAFDASGTQQFNFQVYPDGYQGGVRVAACDFDGDGQAEILSVVGPGGAPHVRLMKFDGAGQLVADLASFFAYDPGFVGGLFAACGDLDGDGVPEIVLGVDAGGGPHLRALRYTPPIPHFPPAPGNVTPLIEAFVYDPGFRGGVRVAAGNVDGGDRDSIVIAAGPGGGPHVRVLRWDGSQLVEPAGFFVYDPGFTAGVFVAAGDVTGDGIAEIVTGADAGGGPHVRVFDGAGVDTGVSFFAYPPGFTGGVRVAAGSVGGVPSIVTGTGAGGGPQVGIFTGAGAAINPGFLAY